MKKDIRSFFGSTQKQETSSSSSSTKSPGKVVENSKSNIADKDNIPHIAEVKKRSLSNSAVVPPQGELVDILDSDDEGNRSKKSEVPIKRKRLRKYQDLEDTSAGQSHSRDPPPTSCSSIPIGLAPNTTTTTTTAPLEEITIPSPKRKLHQEHPVDPPISREKKSVPDAQTFFNDDKTSIASKMPATMIPVLAEPKPEKRSDSNTIFILSDDDDEAHLRAAKAIRAKPVPAVTDDHLPLTNVKVALTGVTEKFDRSTLEERIMTLGGKVMNSISGKTNYLVIGDHLEDGRPVTEGSKYRNAIEKKVKILTEQQFIDLIESLSHLIPPTSQNKASRSTSSRNSDSFGGMMTASKNSQSNTNNVLTTEVTQSNRDMMLWVDKYVPSSSSEMVGSADVARKLAEWLKKWEGVNIEKSVKVPFSKDNPGAKAALLSGPPGIGKTTLATLIARELDYDILELNASDTRNKKQLDTTLLDAVSSRAIVTSGGCSLKKRLIIMDEVDGMGGSDRGGMAELIKVIKISKVPIICICNDRQSTKVRSLSNHCFDLRVKRPTKGQIATRLSTIANKEGLQLDANAAEMLAETSGNDIRQALNALQMWKSSSNSCRYAEMKNGLQRIEKDRVLRQSPFDACLSILAGARGESKLEERYNAFFIDYSLVPLLVQHNYIDTAKTGLFKINSGGNDDARQELLWKASSAVSDMDLIGRAIMGNDQHWELLPAQAASAVRVGSITQGFQAFPAFPAWLGKYSSTNKSARLTREIVHHTSLSIGQGFCPIRLDYIPYLTQRLLWPLISGGSEGVVSTIDMLDEYGMDRDDFMDTLRGMQFTIDNDKVFKDAFELLDSKVKTALTKAYNSSVHRSQILIAELGLKARRRTTGIVAAPSALAYNEEGFLIDDNNLSDEERDLGDDAEDGNIAAFISKGKSHEARKAVTEKVRTVITNKKGNIKRKKE